MKIKIILFFFAISFGFNSNAQDKNTDIELPALRTSKYFSKGYRILKTTISNPAVFDAKFPDTDFSIAYVLRYYFYTGIDLSSTNNELISMNGSSFEITETNDPLELARTAIYEIRDMSFGYREYKDFTDKYFSRQ